jgi:DeoR/GlpR family transcriptional regulator of sugar metabolism
VSNRKTGTEPGRLAYERQREILSQLQGSVAVRVTELARQLGVTKETIRRDLDKLGREGLLRRTHGGAVPARDDHRDLPFAERRSAHVDDKRSIARLAVDRVVPGDVIALDASSTAHQIAQLLPDIDVTVVTNSLPATIALAARTRARVMSTGGTLDPRSMSWIGSFAEDALRRIHVGKLFLSSQGVDLTRGLSEVDDAQAAIKRRMMDAAETVYLLVDHSKFDLRSVVVFAELHEIDTVITDAGASDDVLARLGEIGVATLLAGDATAIRGGDSAPAEEDDDERVEDQA